jgi:AmiR/NasT family two-component response regulator
LISARLFLNASKIEGVAMKVLVVEDEPIIALDLEKLVLDNGFEVVGCARTQAEAIALAPRADIALVEGNWPMVPRGHPSPAI